MRPVQDSWASLVASRSPTFDVAACWQVPKRLRSAEIGRVANADESSHQSWLQGHLRHYFNRLDRAVLKSAYRNKAIRIPRFVTLEYTDEVGWHAHGLLSTPAGVDQAKFVQRTSWLWLRYLGQYAETSFADYLVWSKPTSGNYLGYITKTLDHSGSTQAGVVDLVNTFLPAA